ncbi:MAG: phosphoribosylamine--glycine ligase [Bacteroidetes bacterium]|nr:phosphoribosylamine--glycine ligase [Bacteroidota bacterium]
MNILILGSGGREHALAWKIMQSPDCNKLFIAPGNAGTAQCGTNIEFSVNDFEAQKIFCLQEQIDMLVVGPEEPLVNGIYDFYSKDEALKKIMVIGPSSHGAQLEGSKDFSKKFMQRYQIPTATYASFDESNFDEGLSYLQTHSLPVVLKADGLAAGKGVVICQTTQEACEVFTEMIRHKQFGNASKKVVVEQFLDGVEVSVFVLTNGHQYKIIGHAKDYKQIGEGNKGANTGGMGCVSPVPFMDSLFFNKIQSRIIGPTIKGLQEEAITYHGFIFFGLINVQGEPFVIEYNCRMGDPETEVVMPLLKNDLVTLFCNMHENKLDEVAVEYDERACATVVAVSGGYPGAYEKNKEIQGLPSNIDKQSIIFHAGTQSDSAGRILTNGGRVLAVTSYGESLYSAAKKSTDLLSGIHFDGIYFRKDIGFEFF